MYTVTFRSGAQRSHVEHIIATCCPIEKIFRVLLCSHRSLYRYHQGAHKTSRNCHSCMFLKLSFYVKNLSNSSKNKRLQDNLEIFFILLLILTKRKWKIRRFKMITASSGKKIVPRNPPNLELGDSQTTTRE